MVALEYYTTHIYTVITITTVRAPWWPVELTCSAPFHSYCDAIYVNVFIEWCSEIIILRFIFMC